MDTMANRADWVGKAIDGRFTLLRWLGGSEAGDVFLTELQGPPSQQAAIKLMPAGSPDADAHIAAWKVTANLSHPHLMRLISTGLCEVDGVPMLYAVTEYSDELLSQILPERPLAPAEVREMLDPVLDALSWLHSKGIVHGHLKPSNVMVVDNQLKLSSDSLHLAGTPRGRSARASIYDAPESGAWPVAPAADLWSLGITLVEALTQRPPVWDKSAHTDPPVPESIPQPFAAIVRECLRTDPARRCSLSDVRARLQPAASLPAATGKTSGILPPNVRGMALIGGVVVLAVIVGGLLLRSRHVQPPAPSEDKPLVQIPKPSPSSPVPKPRASKLAAEAPTATVQPPVATPPAAAQAQEVTKPEGAIIEQVQPDVLPGAQASITGQVNVAVRVTVDASGDVSDATIDSPGPSKYFAKVSQLAAQRWKFKPAQVNGQAVSSVWILHFHYTQTENKITPVKVSP